AAIGITNQRETTIVWDKDTGRPLAPAIVWQCRRTADAVEALKAAGLSDRIREKTGLLPDAYFSATKLAWILDNVPGVREMAEAGQALFGTVDTWLLWKLTGEHRTDRTNASRTMLYNIHTLDWDPALLDLFRIPRAMLPAVEPSGTIFGYANLSGKEIPVAGIAGDQQAALFGQTCFTAGEAKNTYGTGCFLLMHTGSRPVESRNGLITTIAAGLAGEEVPYALEGSVFCGGSVIQWLRDELRLFSDSRDAEYLASKVNNTGGVYLVPAFTGLGAPWWDMYARGTLVGITRGTKREHIIRAAEEAIAYQCADLVHAMQQDAGVMHSLRADGGACRDDFLMQFQADICDMTITRPVNRESTALGAAYLAGLTTGVWKDRSELLQNAKCDREFIPDMASDKREKLLAGWHKAVKRSLEWAKEEL
ncbi:MAG: glycerol kinase GlpK, partial [Clostridia bacterium]|nr:glycerol kinase GlpK [Clostridia bacterium]